MKGDKMTHDINCNNISISNVYMPLNISMEPITYTELLGIIFRY
jgi:hypothetical protein